VSRSGKRHAHGSSAIAHQQAKDYNRRPPPKPVTIREATEAERERFGIDVKEGGVVSKGISIAQASVRLGISPAAARQRLYAGTLKGRKLKRGWVVYLNGNEPAAPKPPSPDISDPLVQLADELISIGRRLKRSIKEHDAAVRRDTIVEFATSVAEAAKKGG
jgi:hypothetical protein